LFPHEEAALEMSSKSRRSALKSECEHLRDSAADQTREPVTTFRKQTKQNTTMYFMGEDRQELIIPPKKILKYLKTLIVILSSLTITSTRRLQTECEALPLFATGFMRNFWNPIPAGCPDALFGRCICIYGKIALWQHLSNFAAERDFPSAAYHQVKTALDL
jgi:hypothetical protein